MPSHLIAARVVLMACLAGLALDAVGCSRGARKATGRAAGQVTFGAEPVTKGYVSLFSRESGAAAGGHLDPLGRFEFETPLPVGRYIVSVTPPPSPSPMQGPPTNPQDYPNIPAEYHSELSSQLTVDVLEGDNDLVIELKKGD